MCVTEGAGVCACVCACVYYVNIHGILTITFMIKQLYILYATDDLFI
jgi:hypothetical protein